MFTLLIHFAPSFVGFQKAQQRQRYRKHLGLIKVDYFLFFRSSLWFGKINLQISFFFGIELYTTYWKNVPSELLYYKRYDCFFVLGFWLWLWLIMIVIDIVLFISILVNSTSPTFCIYSIDCVHEFGLFNNLPTNVTRCVCLVRADILFIRCSTYTIQHKFGLTTLAQHLHALSYNKSVTIYLCSIFQPTLWQCVLKGL